MHLSLPVTKLEEAGRFYEGLLGTPPTRSFPGYTHFVTPTVNLALTAAQEVRVSDSEHFGVEVPNVEAVEVVRERLSVAGFAVQTEESTRCCHSLQTKVWAVDPDGRRWETFFVMERELTPVDAQATSCCT
jgi:catechol 2,3-dioxygenase-like lactoylglutathione lyase family enzyme